MGRIKDRGCILKMEVGIVSKWLTGWLHLSTWHWYDFSKLPPHLVLPDDECEHTEWNDIEIIHVCLQMLTTWNSFWKLLGREIMAWLKFLRENHLIHTPCPRRRKSLEGWGEDTFLNGKYMYIDTCRSKVPQDFGNIFF